MSIKHLLKWEKIRPGFTLLWVTDYGPLQMVWSVVFQTTDQEYGRVFFYRFLNKNKGMGKEAPSPADLLKELIWNIDLEGHKFKLVAFSLK